MPFDLVLPKFDHRKGFLTIMSQNYFDSSPDNDWDDKGELSWNEFDWQRFLQRHEEEVTQFVRLYNEHFDSPQRLDEVAAHMHWDEQDWAVSDPLEDEDDDDEEESAEGKGDMGDPYTTHRHPVFVVFRGLTSELTTLWENHLQLFETKASAADIFRFSKVLNEVERHGLLSVQALDLGDYALGVCHLKLLLERVNTLFRHIGGFVDPTSPATTRLYRATRVRLFDLREVALRVMHDCREEIRRGWLDNE